MFPPDKIELPHSNENDLDDVPSIGREFVARRTDHQDVLRTDNWRRAVAGYLACIRFADDMIGELLDALESSSYADNTMIVLWGDHGWHLGEKLHWRKFALWEEATRVPLMISAPGIAPGKCERTVSLVDLYPTFVDVCDLSQKNGLDGVSLKPLMKQPNREWNRPALTTHQRGNHSVRSERWRYIRYSDGAEELYDHENDKLEWTNLAGQTQYKDIIAAHAAWIPKAEAPTAEPLRRE
jgi:arylsulfatase A-like enzyme